MRKWIVVALLALAAVPACGSEDDGTTRQAVEEPDPVCEPGRSVTCAGPQNCQGGQVCKDDGSGWGDCLCEAPIPDGGTCERWENEDWALYCRNLMRDKPYPRRGAGCAADAVNCEDGPGEELWCCSYQ